MRRYLGLGRIGGVAVYLHWSVLLAFAVLLVYSGDILESIIGLASYIALLAVHEFGHAVVARRLGLEVLGVYIYFLHGLCEFEQPENQRKEVAVAWGGVAAQAAAFTVFYALFLALSAVPANFRDLLIPVFWVFLPINLLTIVVNLLPIQPLDGYTAWRIVPMGWRRLFGARRGSSRKPKLGVVKKADDAGRVVTKLDVRSRKKR